MSLAGVSKDHRRQFDPEAPLHTYRIAWGMTAWAWHKQCAIIYIVAVADENKDMFDRVSSYSDFLQKLIL